MAVKSSKKRSPAFLRSTDRHKILRQHCVDDQDLAFRTAKRFEGGDNTLVLQLRGILVSRLRRRLAVRTAHEDSSTMTAVSPGALATNFARVVPIYSICGAVMIDIRFASDDTAQLRSLSEH